ncbi:hypothetical protein [Streptomyces cellostaticus]|nr:hypothetical protein [Streptomyces cellostaticus]GHI10069.1 hypothetical protein Scel_83900 [Streptomyces cellostaticus]
MVWYTLHGHHPADAAEHRERAPWYTTKAGRPTDEEIRAVQQAWAAASAA